MLKNLFSINPNLTNEQKATANKLRWIGGFLLFVSLSMYAIWKLKNDIANSFSTDIDYRLHPIATIIGRLVTPLVVSLVMFISLTKKFNKHYLGIKNCPYCAEAIKREATVCKHCHKELLNEAEPAQKIATIKNDDSSYKKTEEEQLALKKLQLIIFIAIGIAVIWFANEFIK